MSLMENTGGNMVMPVGPMNGYGGGNGMGWGDGSFWIIVLFLFALMGGGNWGNGFNGSGGGAPYVINNDLQRGFDQAAVTSGITDIATNLCNGFAGVNQAMCNGFAGVSNGFAQAEIANNARQIADMQQGFASQTSIMNGLNTLQSQFAQCCCDNRAAIADLKYTVATENCSDRNALAQGVQEIIANQNAGIQAIKDQLCQQEIDALKTQNANLQTQLNMANLAASQGVQTATILADNAAQTAQLLPKPAIPAYVVANPNGCCSQAYNGCGCGVA